MQCFRLAGRAAQFRDDRDGATSTGEGFDQTDRGGNRKASHERSFVEQSFCCSEFSGIFVLATSVKKRVQRIARRTADSIEGTLQPAKRILQSGEMPERLSGKSVRLQTCNANETTRMVAVR